MSIEHELKRIRCELECLVARQERLESIVQQIWLALCPNHGAAVDLSIVFESLNPTTAKGKNYMASNKKASGPAVKCPCLAPKSNGMKATMPDVTLTDPLPKSITLQPLDANGAPVALTPADVVTGTLVSSGAALVITPGTDSVNWIATVPANTQSGATADLVATLKGTIAGAAADLNANVHVIINVPPSPTAVDLAIIFA